LLLKMGTNGILGKNGLRKSIKPTNLYARVLSVNKPKE